MSKLFVRTLCGCACLSFALTTSSQAMSKARFNDWYRGTRVPSSEPKPAPTKTPAPVVTPKPTVTATPTPSPVVTATPSPSPIVTATPKPSPVVIAPVDPAPPGALPCTVKIGNADGKTLNITQASLGLKDGDVVCVKAGSYGDVNISDIRSNGSKPIVIQNDGGVVDMKDTAMNISNLYNVVISGAGTPGVKYGFSIHDNSYRAINAREKFQNFTMQYVNMENIQNYGLTFEGTDWLYDGTDATVFLNIKLLHMRSKNAGHILALGGGANENELRGVSKNLEVAYCEILDQDPDTAIWLTNAFNVNIHHNTFLNVGLKTAHHNRIISLSGDGEIHDNHFENILGNSVKLDPYSYGKVGTVKIYKNVINHTTKYSGFEINPNTDPLIGGRNGMFPANSIFEDNVVGNLNSGIDLPADYIDNRWVASMIDVYNYNGGTLTLRNNIVYNIIFAMAGGGPIENVQGGFPAKYRILENNVYYNTAKEAGF